MGFQTGSKIDPRLGALDYSGYARAGAIQGEAIANMGKQIGAGIEKYAKKKEDKDKEDGMVDFLVQTKAFGDATPEQIRAGLRGAGGANHLMGVVQITQNMLDVAQDRPTVIAQNQANLAATKAGTAGIAQRTEQSASAFPTEQAIREQGLLSSQQQYDQNASMFNPQFALANLGVKTAQQTYDQNEAINPLQIDSQTIMNNAALQQFDIAGQKELREAGIYSVDLMGKQQNIAASIASIDNSKKTLALETRKINLLEEQYKANSTNAQVQANMLQMVIDGDMSHKEYINAGGDMDALRKATELTEGQTARGNADMIAAVKEVNPNYRYNPATNDWTDTSGINEDGIQWSDPRIKRILGTRESQVMGNAGWGVVGNISN